jgi:AcrR family transcriptional regulator
MTARSAPAARGEGRLRGGSGVAKPSAVASGGRSSGVLGEDRQRLQIAEIQRSRLLAGAVRAVEELGYTHTTVAHITARARVSRRTFYELFANRDECLAAVLEDFAQRTRQEIAKLDLGGRAWCEQVRGGVETILAAFDAEPQLARVCVVQAQRAGAVVHDYREELVAQMVAIVDEGRRENTRGAQLSPLTAEGLVGAALAIVHARLLRREREPLTVLRGELMALIVLPYLGAAAARREQSRPGSATAGAATARSKDTTTAVCGDPLDGIPMRLTYRTTLVLKALTEHPQASNRMVAAHAGIADQGQASKLLARLQRLGLLAKASEGHLKGEPNAWALTARGRQVAESIRVHSGREGRAA